MILKFLAIFLLLWKTSPAEKARFDGFSVLRVIPKSEKQLLALKQLLRNSQLEIDVWRFPGFVGQSADIQISPEHFFKLNQTLTELGFRSELLIRDVQKLISEQERKNKEVKETAEVFNYGKYHTLDEVNNWIDNVTKFHPNITSVFEVTKSYEGRTIRGIKISTGDGKSKPGFFIEGGIHSREWISPATVLFMAGQMLDRYTADLRIKQMVDSFNWFILPVFNVDGYEYTWSKNRNWRKTRSKHGLCVGVDPNRNWDYDWCKEGASKDPCSDMYCGPKAFSEVEVKGVADFIMKNSKGMKGFIDFHSFAQLWMSPWGYTTKLPPDFKDQDKGSQLAVEALEKVYGTKYKHGSIANTIYVASGSSADWTYGAAKIKYSYGVELRDTGKYGFLLPPEEIIPSGKETLEALIALANYVVNN
ncbi:carboxypeptidase B-like [Saccostrea cucullata]|uniref:carboxypeptidase B-like n=1 Tax=Saccostrea cuccullata TaxID=36930 RepID=UPI002ED08F41